MANIMNKYFSSVFTIEQLNNVPQLRQYEGNILDTLNFSTEEVQEKLQHLNIYKSIIIIIKLLYDYCIAFHQNTRCSLFNLKIRA